MFRDDRLRRVLNGLVQAVYLGVRLLHILRQRAVLRSDSSNICLLLRGVLSELSDAILLLLELRIQLVYLFSLIRIVALKLRQLLVLDLTLCSQTTKLLVGLIELLCGLLVLRVRLLQLLLQHLRFRSALVQLQF